MVGDQDLDALLGRGVQRRLNSNLTRHLAWRAIPRIGKPLVMDVFGAPGAPFLLLAALGTSKTTLPYGPFWLAPPVLPAGSGLLDGQGRASLSFAGPATLSLVGLSLYWQAVLGLPLSLTNLEVTTFTNL